MHLLKWYVETVQMYQVECNIGKHRLDVEAGVAKGVLFERRFSRARSSYTAFKRISHLGR